MSLGLGDLNKKRRPIKKPAKTIETKPAITDLTNGKGAWTRSRTMRPWSDPVPAQSVSREHVSPLDTVMSADSFHHESVFYWADISNTSLLATAHSKLAALEELAQDLIKGPLARARTFISR